MEEENENLQSRIASFLCKVLERIRNSEITYIFHVSHVRNNLHMRSIFIEKHITIHEVMCHFMNRNIHPRINVDIKSIRPNNLVNITILTIGSYCITNKTE